MNPPTTRIPLLEPIRPQLEMIERLLQDLLEEADEPLRSMLQHSLTGGKRLRPALIVLVGRMFKSHLEPFYSLAAAVEMLHTATLIHDDLVDKDATRRNEKSLHAIWPTEAIVLAGDYLLARAISLLTELGNLRMLGVFAQTLSSLCQGEIMQVLYKEKIVSKEEYYRLIEAKTASLLAASAEMAGILAGAEEGQVASLHIFGRELGMAYQIANDVMDFFSDGEQLGKPAGSDLQQGFITLPTIFFLEKAQDPSLLKAVLAGQRDEERVRAAISMVRSSGSLKAAIEEARAHVRRGQEALATLPDNTYRHMIHSLTEFTLKQIKS